jgi:hypothetical protein
VGTRAQTGNLLTNKAISDGVNLVERKVDARSDFFREGYRSEETPVLSGS